MSERDTPNEADAPLVGNPPADAAAPMRLRAEPPQVVALWRIPECVRRGLNHSHSMVPGGFEVTS